MERSSNFELLRIITMIFIIMHHYMCHGVFQSVDNINNIIVIVAFWGGKVGINVFVLITGYYMVKSTVSLRKVLILWGEVIFYSVVITIVFILLEKQTCNASVILNAMFPLILGRHNYITTYIILYCMVPHINKMIHNITKKDLDNLLVLMTFALSIIPTICELHYGWVNNAYSYVFWMIYVYLLGAKIKLYGIKLKKNTIAILAILSIVFLWGASIFCGSIGIGVYYFVGKTYTVPVLLCSVLIFCAFRNVNIGSKKWINAFAKTTLGVYLLHDDELIRNYIWTNVFNGNKVSEPIMLIANIVLSTIAVYSICVIIDWVRIITVEKLYVKLINKFNICEKLTRLYDSIFDKVLG